MRLRPKKKDGEDEGGAVDAPAPDDATLPEVPTGSLPVDAAVTAEAAAAAEAGTRRTEERPDGEEERDSGPIADEPEPVVGGSGAVGGDPGPSAAPVTSAGLNPDASPSSAAAAGTGSTAGAGGYGSPGSGSSAAAGGGGPLANLLSNPTAQQRPELVVAGAFAAAFVAARILKRLSE